MNAFTTDSKDLLTALSLVTTAIDSSARLPVFSMLLLDADGSTLRLTAASFTHTLTTTIDAICDDPLTTCVSAKQLANLVRLCPNQLLTLKQNDERWLTVTANGSRHRLPALTSKYFPLPDKVEGEATDIAGSLLASLLTSALAGTDPNPNIELRWQALELSAKDGVLSVTGCCGPRLCNVTAPFAADFYALLPLRSVPLLVALAGRSEVVGLSVTPNHLSAISAVGSVVAQLSAMPWPDWRLLIQPAYPLAFTFDAGAMATALKRAMVVAEADIVQRVVVELTPERAVLTCSSQAGDSRESVAVTGNGAVTIPLSGKPLLDLLRLLDGPIAWQVESADKPVVFTQDNMRYLQLPLR